MLRHGSQQAGRRRHIHDCVRLFRRTAAFGLKPLQDVQCINMSASCLVHTLSRLRTVSISHLCREQFQHTLDNSHGFTTTTYKDFFHAVASFKSRRKRRTYGFLQSLSGLVARKAHGHDHLQSIRVGCEAFRLLPSTGWHKRRIEICNKQ